MLSTVQKQSNRLALTIGNGVYATFRSSHFNTLHNISIHNFHHNNLTCFRSLSIAGSDVFLRHSSFNNGSSSLYNNITNYHQKRNINSKQQSHGKDGKHYKNWRGPLQHNKEHYNLPEGSHDFEPSGSSSIQKSFNFDDEHFIKNKYKSQKFKNRNKSRTFSTNIPSSDNDDSNDQPNRNEEIQPESVAQPSIPVLGEHQRARLQAQQALAKEDEIDPFSFGGLFLFCIGASIFYWLFNIDQQKHSEISTFLSRFTRTKSIDDYISIKESNKPFICVPDTWNAFNVIVDHLTRFVSLTSYNSESIISKLFRLFYIPSKKLLPPVKSNIYTLVIDLDTICHSTWSRNDGFERKMRPYYSEFIKRMAMSGWEIVLFGLHEEFDWIESPDMAKLETGFVAHYLWNKDAYYFRGHRCKDLGRLNRDLKRVIVIDSDPRAVQLTPENAIMIKKWTSNEENDVSLLRLIEFLEYLAKAEVSDVRQVLSAYRGKDIAQEFRARYLAHLSEMQKGKETQFEDEGEQGFDDEHHHHEEFEAHHA